MEPKRTLRSILFPTPMNKTGKALFIEIILADIVLAVFGFISLFVFGTPSPENIKTLVILIVIVDVLMVVYYLVLKSLAKNFVDRG